MIEIAVVAVAIMISVASALYFYSTADNSDTDQLSVADDYWWMLPIG
jgi:hypothetical protein